MEGSRRKRMLPFAASLGHGNEVAPEKDAADTGKREQPLGERRAFRLRRGPVFGRAGAEDGLPGKEFQRRRIGRGLGLDQHAADVAS